MGRVGSTTDLVTQKFLKVNEEEKREVLCDLIQNCGDGLTLIFVETKKSADYLEHYLCSQDFPAISIHGDRTQSEREYALRSFKNGTTPFLIATNVASRGLDIRQINFVINYDMPNDIDEYVHRIGRTGRAGKAGVATSLVSPANKGIVRELIDILAEAGQEIPPWLESMKSYGGMRGGGRRRGGGGGGGGGGDRYFFLFTFIIISLLSPLSPLSLSFSPFSSITYLLPPLADSVVAISVKEVEEVEGTRAEGAMKEVEGVEEEGLVLVVLLGVVGVPGGMLEVAMEGEEAMVEAMVEGMEGTTVVAVGVLGKGK